MASYAHVVCACTERVAEAPICVTDLTTRHTEHFFEVLVMLSDLNETLVHVSEVITVAGEKGC